ncbi:MAG: M20 family metallopeptidase [Thermoproteota archaeon]
MDTRKAVELTKKLVRARSTNPPGDEKFASDVVINFLEEIGIGYVEQKVSDNRYNIIASLKGRNRHRSLLFTSHLDVVPPGDERMWIKDPFCGEEIGGLIYGRGSTDAKGSLGAMLCAMESIVESGVELSGDLILAAVVGEETDNLGIRHLIEGSNFRIDMALVGEPTKLRVANTHKGIARFNIHVSGKAAHACLPSRGVNAISGMAKVVIGLDYLSSNLQIKDSGSFPTLVISTIKGGIKDNIVPPNCSITVDRRLVVGESPESAEQEITEVVNSALKGSTMKTKVEPYLMALPTHTSANEPIVLSSRKAVNKVLGKDLGLYNFEAYCDMGPLVEKAGAKTVILGPGSLEGSHIENEVVSIEEIESAAKIYALIAFDVLSS